MRGSASFFISSFRISYFNSRLYMRGSMWEILKKLRRSLFQFTPLHERQLYPANGFFDLALFQFTPLHERQHAYYELMVAACIFQFTPLHERQRILFVYRYVKNLFQFTPLHERQQIPWRNQ